MGWFDKSALACCIVAPLALAAGCSDEDSSETTAASASDLAQSQHGSHGRHDRDEGDEDDDDRDRDHVHRHHRPPCGGHGGHHHHHDAGARDSGHDSGEDAGTGSIAIDGSTNVCPSIDSFSAAPLTTHAGGMIALTGSATDPDNGPSPLSYAWAASSGTLANASTANASWTCTSLGTVTITLTVSDGECGDSATFQVTCN